MLHLYKQPPFEVETGYKTENDTINIKESFWTNNNQLKKEYVQFSYQ